MSKLGPKCQYFVWPPLFSSTGSTLLSIEFTRASQVAPGVLHFSTTTSQSWWTLETLRSTTFRLRMFNRVLVWRHAWPVHHLYPQLLLQGSGHYHVGILPCSPVSEGRGSCSALVCHSTCWHSWFPQRIVAPQCRQHSCSPRP